VLKSIPMREREMLRNPHFWVNLAITAFIGYVYYNWFRQFDWFWHFSMTEALYHAVGSLFLIPFVYSCIVFRFRGASFFWTLALLIALPHIAFFSFRLVWFVSNIFFASLPLMIVGLITLELNWRNRQSRMMEKREEERQIYLTQIFRAQESERQRIALELHDSCMQDLIVVANRANDLAELKNSENITTINDISLWIRDSVMHVSDELRRISLNLRPSLLDNLGLVSAIRWLADYVNRQSQIDVKVLVEGEPKEKLSTESETTIFRIVQEALNNVRRHSGASEATVCLEFKPESISMTIQDNGKGFDWKSTYNDLTSKNQLGILSMEKRAKSLNGSLSISSQPGKGTRITIGVPCRQ